MIEHSLALTSARRYLLSLRMLWWAGYVASKVERINLYTVLGGKNLGRPGLRYELIKIYLKNSWEVGGWFNLAQNSDWQILSYLRISYHSEGPAQFGIRCTFGQPYRAGLANLWHTERIRWHTAFSAVPIVLFLSPYQRLHIVQIMCVYTHISDCIETVHELPLLPNNTAVTHF